MTNFGPQKFSIDSTLELVADGWTAEVPDSVLFRAASITDRVTLKGGFLSSTGAPLVIASIISGVIDEYELVMSPTNISGRVRGRDPSAAILDSFYQRTYTRLPVAVSTDAGYVEKLPTVPADAVLENVTVGDISAKQIATDAVASVGLTLDWAVRDYKIQSTFQASGRIVDTLRRVVEPWTLVEPFRVDIYLQGSTVFVKHRQLPTQPLVPQYTFSLAETKRGQLTARKRRFKKIGVVTLRGMRVPDNLGIEPSPVDGIAGLVFVAGNETVTLVSEAFTGGVLASRTISTETYRMPDRITIRTIKEVLTAAPPDSTDLVLQSRETIEYGVEASIYDFSGPINQPKQLNQRITREAIDPDDEVFKVLATEETIYDYDDLNFLSGQTTIKKKFDADEDALLNNEMTIETLRDIGSLFCERIVEVYNFDTDEEQWVIQRRDTSLAGGHRPGGPGRGNSVAGLPKGTGADKAFKNLIVTATLSTDTDAQDIEYTNENLTLEDLNFILSLFQATVGLYEWELQFDGVAMPWFRRGMTIKFADVFSEDNITLIDIPVCMITSINASYDESNMRSSFTQSIRAFGIKSGG